MTKDEYIKKLREALSKLIEYSPSGTVACRGDKCRKEWCISCCFEEDAEAFVQQIFNDVHEAGRLIALPIPASVADATDDPGYVMVPVAPTEEMLNNGSEVAHELIDANVCKNMNGLGGGKTWDEFRDYCKHLDLCEKYVNGEIDSINAIYRAMIAARTKE